MKLKKFTACILAGAVALTVALTGCGSSVDQNAVGAILDGKEISLGQMNFLARYQQAISDASMLYLFGPEMWTTEISEGKTMEDSTKESVLNIMETNYLLEAHMADYGVEITEEELQAIETAAKKFMSDNSSKAIKQMGATEEYVKEMLRLNTIAQKMQAAIREAADVTVSDEEAARRTFSYFKASAPKGTDEEGNATDPTEEEKEAFAKEMEGIAADAKEDFEGAAESKGYTVSKHSYGEGVTTLDEAVYTAADALKEGEISDLITVGDEYYVLRLDSEFDEEATASAKEALLNQKKSEAYTAVCDGYKEAASFEVNEEAWATVKFDRLFGVAGQEQEGAN